MSRYLPDAQRHKCAVPSCDRQISYTYLMCREHWAQVDPDLAFRLYFAWASWKNAPSAGLGKRAWTRKEDYLQQALAQVAAAAKPASHLPTQP
jgi:hypothetical protein